MSFSNGGTGIGELDGCPAAGFLGTRLAALEPEAAWRGAVRDLRFGDLLAADDSSLTRSLCHYRHGANACRSTRRGVSGLSVTS
jgi:hypothetical protein